MNFFQVSLQAPLLHMYTNLLLIGQKNSNLA
jgi:hypothetical protein